MESEFREASIILTGNIRQTERKEQGIYFTPQRIRRRLLDVISANHHIPTSILEPSFGSGEFLYDCHEKWPDVRLTGIEKNTTLYESLMSSSNTESLALITPIHTDFLEFPTTPENKYDTIIGNPPFFVMKPPPDSTLYRESSTGRCNIFILFLYKCLRYHLLPDGVLGFVLPTSVYNCSYYNKCRKYIKDNCTVLHAETLLGKFMGTTQETCILVIKKTRYEGAAPPYIVSLSGRDMIVPEYEILRSILSRSHTTIASLGAKVKTGKVVWNQVKSSLTDEESDETIPLVYDHNIRNENTLDLSAVTKNKEKRRYVNKTAISAEPTTTSSIVVRRGYGNTFKFRYAMAPPGIFGENHVNVITPPDADVLSKIYKSFGDEDTLRFGKIVFGNGSVSKTELEGVIPIFTDVE